MVNNSEAQNFIRFTPYSKFILHLFIRISINFYQEDTKVITPLYIFNP